MMPHDYKAPRRSSDSIIARARLAKGMTQEQIAQMLGVNKRQVSAWENNQFAIPIHLLPMVADVLGIDLTTLIENQVQRKNDSPIAAARRAKGWTQAQLAKAVGISQGKISQYETGAAPIPPKAIKAISEALGVPLGEIQTKGNDSPIAAARRAKGWTQAQLAEKSGMSYSAITKYENGTINIPERSLARLAETLDVPIDTLRTEEQWNKSNT